MPPVDVMKIDVEGFESEVMRGASTLLSTESHQPCVILFEWLPAIQREQSEHHQFGWGSRSLLDTLTGHGYKLYRHGGRQELLSYTELEDGDYEFRSRAPRCRYAYEASKVHLDTSEWPPKPPVVKERPAPGLPARLVKKLIKNMEQCIYPCRYV